VINDLLDLTKTEEGQELIKDEILDLSACLKEATEPFKMDAKRKGIEYEVVEHPGLPRLVHGDYRRVRQAIANMTANAVEHTTKGSVKIECFVTEVVQSRVKIEVVVQDTGRGMSNAKLDALFQELEQVSSDNSNDDEVETAIGDRPLGLGLAVVARIVRNMDGQLRLKSEEGVGSRFVIQLPFDLPSGETPQSPETDKKGPTSSIGNSSLASVSKSLPPAEAGEVMLVDRGLSANTPTANPALRERRSFDDAGSIQSLKSVASLRSATSMGSGVSNRSDADRLIDAISNPLPYGEGDPDSIGLQRRPSKDSSHAHRHSGTSAKSLPFVGAQVGERRLDRPAPLTRSTTSPSVHPDASTSASGVHPVKDSKTPIKPIKVPDDFSTSLPAAPQTGQQSGVLFEIPDRTKTEPAPAENAPEPSASGFSGKLRVLIAEDDPVNMKILRKRLEKAGHDVIHTVNGEDCAAVYSERPLDFDVILMDMQVRCRRSGWVFPFVSDLNRQML
jgi:anti-sigma regulatory factor (Ser/Thr protein kinase)